MNKQLFIALPLPRALQETLERRTRQQKGLSYVRWTPVSNFHVTALFIGDVPEEIIPQLKDVLKDAVAAVPRFDLQLERIAYAPPGQQAKMIWAYIKQLPAFLELVATLSRAVQGVVGTPSDRFKELKEPHITLARFNRKVTPQELIFLEDTDCSTETLPVTEILLMETSPSAQGSTYAAHARFPLA